MNVIKSIFQMAFSKRKSPENSMEQGRSHPSHPSMTTTLPVQEAQLPHIDRNGRPEFSPDDQLNLFRHLVGITSHQSMSHSHWGDESGGRPAPNLGIYARVVNNEMHSKIGHQYFSWLINGCLGLQIVVAAALTAMGAAGANRSAVTVFGAINTVIAGVLTFLKGSGLPNRLKYYHGEWKRVREFIEQRERDFSRPNCDLDLYGVVGMVETMYEEVKRDLEASTPDRFAGFSSGGNHQSQQIEAPNTRPISSLPRTTSEPFSEKFLESGLGSRVKDLASDIGHKADLARSAIKDFQDRKEQVAEDTGRVAKEYSDRVGSLELKFGEKSKDRISDIGQRAHLGQEAVQDLQARQRSHIEGLGKEVRGIQSSLTDLRAASSKTP